MGFESTRLDAMKQVFWQRHANPWSGWTRVLSYPLTILAIYRRDRRLLAGMALFSLLSPIVLPPPDGEDAWQTEAILGERLWFAQGEKVSLVNLLNVANVPVSAYAVYSAYRHRPVRTALATIGSMALKFLFVNELAKYYERERQELPEEA
jgi:hypothetical protein